MPTPSRLLDRVVVRVPDGMRKELAKVAKKNRRSVNAQVVKILESALTEGNPTTGHTA